MRPIIKSNKINADGSSLSFRDWRDAKTDLINEIGGYCSYCERPGQQYPASLQVEHIFAKGLKKYEHLIYVWNNFLLACINCNAVKGSKDFDENETYLPHLNNLLLTIEILEGGGIKVKNDVPEEQQRRTRNFLELVGLDRDLLHPKYSDKRDQHRWASRFDVWTIADKWLKDYQNNEIGLHHIIEMAQSKGYWSIWMKVFHNYPEVKRELIAQFAGTAANCFDQDYNPLPRNGTNP